MKLGRRRQPRAGFTAGLVWSLGVHLGAALFMVAAVKPRMALPPVYAVELVAAPRSAPARRPPAATPTPVERETPAPPRPQTRPVERTPDPDPVPPPAPAEAAPQAAPDPLPEEETPNTGSDITTLKTPGLQFPFPTYLQNIVAQVYRRWDRPRTNAQLRAEVFFTIRRDGSVADIRFISRSGNFSFDLGAQGAIETAGNAGAFGPLPDAFPEDVLPVSFFFTPRQQ